MSGDGFTCKVTGGDLTNLEALINTQGQRLSKANKTSADEFMNLVRVAVPQDPKARGGHLVESLIETSTGPTGWSVSIGSASEPYPAHLEFGHRSRGATHVPAKPFWYPSLRVVRKRNTARILAAQRAAIKATVLAGG